MDPAQTGLTASGDPAQIHADDLYERLGVDREAGSQEVRRAYHKLLRIYPPERAPEEFKRIREAYETLRDPQSRREYDSQPDPQTREWEHGIAALNEKRYTDAERYFKQVLLQSPELAFARNYLGLAFLYQGKGKEAISQYERLISTQPPSATLFGHLGHAYRIDDRGDDAVRAFTRAIELGDEDNVTYYTAIADVHIARKEFDLARKVLEQGIRVDNKVDFEDLPYFTKILEIEIKRPSFEGATDVIQRIEGIVDDDEQSRYVAWKLGILSQQLIEAELFEYALLLASAARRLRPRDEDYWALFRGSKFLHEGDLVDAENLAKHDPSFKKNGWLAELGLIIRKHCSAKRVLADLSPIKRAPSVSTIATIGFRLIGKRDYDELTNSHVAVYYFVVLFCPLLPLGCYRVVRNEDRSWVFLGKVPFSKGEKRAFWVVGALLIIWVFWDTFRL